MKRNLLRARILSTLFAGALALGCSAAPVERDPGSTQQAAIGGAEGAACSETSPCQSHYYCAPSSQACGAGTCMADPAFCPLFEILGVCGCNGTPYLNENCAKVNGTTSAGDRRIQGAAIADVVGTWSRVVSTDTTTHLEIVETLTVNDDSTYTLSQTQRCLTQPGFVCHHTIVVRGESTGTATVAANGGFSLDGTCAVGDCSSLATEFDVEHDCKAYDGPAHIAVIEPPGASEATNTYYLEN